jgi:hypothetical protein
LLVEANERGAVDRARAEEFARHWLAISGGELALSVLEGGPFAAARLIGLCEFVLRMTSESTVALISSGE